MSETTETAVAVIEEKSPIFSIMAKEVNLAPTVFFKTVKAMCFPKDREATNEQFAAFLVVAHHYKLNPLLKEIYAFPVQGGGVQPIVSVDGWLSLANRHPEFDGIELEEEDDTDGNILSVKATLWRKDRKFPTILSESLEECKRNTPQWTGKPRRMLRHKATIQAIRYAFGYGGIMDEDEAQAVVDVQYTEAKETRKLLPSDQPANVNRLIEKAAAMQLVPSELLLTAKEMWPHVARLENLNEGQADELLAKLKADVEAEGKDNG